MIVFAWVVLVLTVIPFLLVAGAIAWEARAAVLPFLLFVALMWALTVIMR